MTGHARTDGDDDAGEAGRGRAPESAPGEPSGLTLDMQLCFPLHSATRAIVSCYRPGLDAIGLTYSQYLVMVVLWEHGPVGLGFLCDTLYMDSGTLSPLVKRLEAQGLVTRRRRARDERVVEVATTPAGEALRRPARDVQAGVAEDTGLDPDELADLRHRLCALADRLRSRAAAARARPPADDPPE